MLYNLCAKYLISMALKIKEKTHDIHVIYFYSCTYIQDVTPTEPSKEVNVYYLDSVSYIGIIITIICLIITVVFYLYNK